MQPRETPEVARIREDSCVSRSYTRWAPIASVAAIAAISPLAASAPAGTGGVSGRDLAGGCFAIEHEPGGFVAVAGAGSYGFAPTRAEAAVFRLQPSGPGTFLPLDQGRGLLAAGEGGRIERAAAPGPGTEWSLRRRSGGSFRLASTAGDARMRVSLTPGDGCAAFPEAEVGARGRPPGGVNPDGTVSGFADAHLHITAEMRAGGRVVHGQSFHRFGITHALGFDEVDHGADGSDDVTGNLLRTGLPFGTHDVHGWPTFAGWPTNDTNTHQQTYYVWLKRAWKAGLRLAVAQTVEDEPLCRIEPRRSHPCDETKAMELEVKRLRALQRYVDAQAGGRGRGWFRLTYGPRQARRVIESGRLAVVIGFESSNLFGCSELMGEPQCRRADIDRGIRTARRLGVRSLFVSHWTNNALGGAALEGGTRGVFINIFNRFQTGRYFDTGECPHSSQGEEVTTLSPGEMGVLAEFFPATRELAEEGMPTYPPGRQCNTKGLTKLGAYAIRRLMANGMLIEADHMSERARAEVLRIAERRDYPLVSSHTGTGGAWTPGQLRRLNEIGGFATVHPDVGPKLTENVLELRRHSDPDRYFGVGLGTDTGGFSTLPGPRDDAASDPLPYPFRSYDGEVEFTRQRSGERTFDLNADGVAHYGLFADLLADTRRQPGGERALRLLSRSAEAYLRTWRRAATGG
jgi:microsomal dipeptidase-like Zn-dependent dipeptidase